MHSLNVEDMKNASENCTDMVTGDIRGPMNICPTTVNLKFMENRNHSVIVNTNRKPHLKIHRTEDRKTIVRYFPNTNTWSHMEEMIVHVTDSSPSTDQTQFKCFECSRAFFGMKKYLFHIRHGHENDTGRRGEIEGPEVTHSVPLVAGKSENVNGSTAERPPQPYGDVPVKRQSIGIDNRGVQITTEECNANSSGSQRFSQEGLTASRSDGMCSVSAESMEVDEVNNESAATTSHRRLVLPENFVIKDGILYQAIGRYSVEGDESPEVSTETVSTMSVMDETPDAKTWTEKQFDSISGVSFGVETKNNEEKDEPTCCSEELVLDFEVASESADSSLPDYTERSPHHDPLDFLERGCDLDRSILSKNAAQKTDVDTNNISVVPEVAVLVKRNAKDTLEATLSENAARKTDVDRNNISVVPEVAVLVKQNAKDTFEATLSENAAQKTDIDMNNISVVPKGAVLVKQKARDTLEFSNFLQKAKLRLKNVPIKMRKSGVASTFARTESTEHLVPGNSRGSEKSSELVEENNDTIVIDSETDEVVPATAHNDTNLSGEMEISVGTIGPIVKRPTAPELSPVVSRTSKSLASVSRQESLSIDKILPGTRKRAYDSDKVDDGPGDDDDDVYSEESEPPGGRMIFPVPSDLDVPVKKRLTRKRSEPKLYTEKCRTEIERRNGKGSRMKGPRSSSEKSAGAIQDHNMDHHRCNVSTEHYNCILCLSTKYTCLLCHRKYSTEKGLRRHEASKHAVLTLGDQKFIAFKVDPSVSECREKVLEHSRHDTSAVKGIQYSHDSVCDATKMDDSKSARPGELPRHVSYSEDAMNHGSRKGDQTTLQSRQQHLISEFRARRGGRKAKTKAEMRNFIEHQKQKPPRKK